MRARRIIAVSEFTRQDILRRFSVEDGFVVKVLEGVNAISVPSDAELAAARKRLGVDRPFFYYPAATTPHKNHLHLLRALRLLGTHGLVLTGEKTSAYPVIGAAIRNLGLQDRVLHLGFVQRRDVICLMAMAEALVFPSRFEGFGLPLLEAMQCGTPVLASNCASIPEVVGGAAWLLDPDSPRDWAQAMKAIIEDRAARQRLVVAGNANVGRYSWARCAEETVGVLRSAAFGSR
jgi:glycosyltransferase involved in cell wall biosynthesis